MKLTAARRLLAEMLALSAVAPAARGILFDLPSSGVKCVSEELGNNVVVLVNFVALYGEHDNFNATIAPSISVLSPGGKKLDHKDKVTLGEFAFTTHVPGNYGACFWVNNDPHLAGINVTVRLQWKLGLAIKDWDSIAKKEKIEIRKLEEAVDSIHQNMISMMHRQMDMTLVNLKMNVRVAHYSIVSIGLCISASVLHLEYLTRYFRKKKLI